MQYFMWRVMYMAIFRFYKIYRGIKEELGEDMVLKLFPEYSTLPEKMSPNEQVRLGKIIMDRMDKLLDKDTIARVRHKHCCNIPKKHIEEIKSLKKSNNTIDEILTEYSKFLSPGHIVKHDNSLMVSFGWGRCVCGMFRKLEEYEPISKTWCECCNGHVIKTFTMICDKPVTSNIVEAVACGGKDCIFEVNI